MFSIYLICNKLCIPESFNTKIFNQFVLLKITFVNSQRENTNLTPALKDSNIKIKKRKSESKVHIY